MLFLTFILRNILVIHHIFTLKNIFTTLYLQNIKWIFRVLSQLFIGYIIDEYFLFIIILLKCLQLCDINIK